MRLSLGGCSGWGESHRKTGCGPPPNLPSPRTAHKVWGALVAPRCGSGFVLGREGRKSHQAGHQKSQKRREEGRDRKGAHPSRQAYVPGSCPAASFPGLSGEELDTSPIGEGGGEVQAIRDPA